jgi:hypothetical protein
MVEKPCGAARGAAVSCALECYDIATISPNPQISPIYTNPRKMVSPTGSHLIFAPGAAHL